MGIWGLDEGKMKGRILYSESEVLVTGIREGAVSNNRYWILLFILWCTSQSWLAVWKTLLDGGIELGVHGYRRHHCMDLGHEWGGYSWQISVRGPFQVLEKADVKTLRKEWTWHIMGA